MRHLLEGPLPLLALSISSATAQQTLVVGPGQAYTTIQPAIAAAAPGDTVLVLAGTYSQSLDINKGIQLIGQGADISGPSGLLSTFALVHDLPANQRFTMAGFRAVQGSNQTVPEAINIVVRDCAGFVALRDLSSSSGFRRFTVSVTGCPQVFVGSLDGYGIATTNSTVVCEGSFLESAGLTLRSIDSTVVVVRCTIRSTNGLLAIPAWVERSRLFTSRSTFVTGSTIAPRPAISATAAELLLDPSTVLQPSGGAPPIEGGVAVPFPFASIRAELTSSALTVLSHGTANEPFATLLGPVVDLQPTPLGLTWLDPTRTSILALASYGANRLHTSTLPLPPLPPGLVVGLQTAGFRGNSVVLGAPSVVVTR